MISVDILSFIFASKCGTKLHLKYGKKYKPVFYKVIILARTVR
jgi:hypothetical protein